MCCLPLPVLSPCRYLSESLPLPCCCPYLSCPAAAPPCCCPLTMPALARDRLPGPCSGLQSPSAPTAATTPSCSCRAPARLDPQALPIDPPPLLQPGLHHVLGHPGQTPQIRRCPRARSSPSARELSPPPADASLTSCAAASVKRLSDAFENPVELVRALIPVAAEDDVPPLAHPSRRVGPSVPQSSISGHQPVIKLPRPAPSYIPWRTPPSPPRATERWPAAGGDGGGGGGGARCGGEGC